MAEKTYDIKRFFVTDASVKEAELKGADSELGKHAVATKELMQAGYKLYSLVPMVASQPGLVSFAEVWVKE
jgi:hypothetical protein